MKVGTPFRRVPASISAPARLPRHLRRAPRGSNTRSAHVRQRHRADRRQDAADHLGPGDMGEV